MTQSIAKIKILIADDHAFTRIGLRRFLEEESPSFESFEASDIQEALKIVDTTPLDAAVLDIQMPEKQGETQFSGNNAGLHLAEYIKKKSPKTGVVLLSSHKDRGKFFWDLVGKGEYRGLGYMLKNGSPDDILNAIRQTIANRIICDEMVTNDREIVEELLRRLSPEERPWILYAVENFLRLTTRQRQIVAALSNSHDLKGVAMQLNIKKESSVSNHLTQIYDELGLSQVPSSLSPRSLLIKTSIIFELQHEQE